MGLFLGDSEPSKIFVGDTPISKVFLGDTQVRPSGWQPGLNTLVYYNINDNDTNTTIYDLSGNNNNQTWYGTAVYNVDTGIGKYANFDGSTYTQTTSRINFGDSVTFVCLFKTASTSVQTLIGECASSSTWNIGISLNCNFAYTDYGVAGVFSGTSDVDNSHIGDTSRPFPTNQWSLVVVTRDSNGTAKLYINGVLVNTKVLTSSPQYYQGEALQIGRWRGAGPQFFVGGFKLFIGEDRCWTDQEIAAFASEYGF